MANFIGYVWGNRGVTSRTGPYDIHANCSAWESGIKVSGYIESPDSDVVEWCVRLVPGSNHNTPVVLDVHGDILEGGIIVRCRR